MEATTGIVILNYGNYNDTINCIKSVYEYCSSINPLIVIVDNASLNDSVAQISSFLAQQNIRYSSINRDQGINILDSKVIIIQNDENLGYARGNNIGIRLLIMQKVGSILILNNDILLTMNIVSPLVHCLDTHPEIGIVSPILLNHENNIDLNCCRMSPTNKMLICESMHYFKIPGIKNIIDKKYLLKTRPNLINQDLVFCDIVSGACMMAKRATWEKLDGFDENTFLYYEENILYEKLKLLNLKMAMLTTVNTIHLGAKATKKVVNTKILRIELDSLLYYLKNYRVINLFEIRFIKFIKIFQINILVLYNLVKKRPKR